MTHPILIVHLPPAEHAVLGMSERLSPESLLELERVLSQAAEQVRHMQRSASPPSGEAEYLSWIPVQPH
jgi:hypothetical protein